MKAKQASALIVAIAILWLPAIREAAHSYPATSINEAALFIRKDQGFLSVRRFIAPRNSWHRRPGMMARAGRPWRGRSPGRGIVSTNPGRWRGPRRTPGLARVPGVNGPGPIVIAGAGGNRPPLSPPSSLPPGQRSSAVAAALLNGKRYRAHELLIQVPNSSAEQLKETFAIQYGVRVREVGVISLINARVWHLTLARNQNLRDVLERLLQDNRILRAQPNYIYTPVQGAAGVKPQANAAQAPINATG